MPGYRRLGFASPGGCPLKKILDDRVAGTRGKRGGRALAVIVKARKAPMLATLHIKCKGLAG